VTSQEIALREAVDGAIAQLRDPEFEQQIALALPDPTLAKRFLRVAATAELEKPELALADRASLIKALLKCAADNLLPDGRQAALVVRRNNQKNIDEVSYQPMIGGVLSVLAEFGWMMTMAVVYANDHFEDHADEGYVVHRRARLGEDRGAPIGAWAMAKHARFGSKALVYDEGQIEAVRKQYSKTDKVWKQRPDQMREKTVGHRLAKTLPLDPKDRERIERILAVQDLNGDDAIDTLYGSGDQPSTAHIPQGADGPGEPLPQERSPATSSDDDIPFGDTEPEFDGEEPNDEPLVGEVVDVDEPTFGGKKYAGKTVQEVWDSGDEGYVRWARRNWKTGPIVAALEAFAQEHPEIDQ
jgi:recombination protein RecT